jgi:hypothetical protein
MALDGDALDVFFLKSVLGFLSFHSYYGYVWLL